MNISVSNNIPNTSKTFHLINSKDLSWEFYPITGPGY